MDEFKPMVKMAHFKEGGGAYCGGGSMKMKTGGKADKDDMKQDKAMIKKAFKQHDEAEHDKEPTEIKLKKGGRSKKDCGTVRKFKVGGSVNNVYEAKKSSGDIDNIEKVKDIKPGKAKSESAAMKRPAMKGSDVEKEKSKPAGDKDSIKKVPPTGDKKANAMSGAKGGPNKYKTGGGVKKYADGSSVDAKAVSDKASRELEEALNPISMGKELYGKAKDYASRLGSGLERAGAAAKAPYSANEIPAATFKGSRLGSGLEKQAAEAKGLKKGGKAKKMNTGGTAS